VERLYVRYFDVDLQGGAPIPVGKLVDAGGLRYTKEIVPTVFITNRSFLDRPPEAVADLAGKVAALIESLHQKIATQTIREVQFDCDWTDRTQSNYFLFLEQIKARRPSWEISATLRLHQIKFPDRTGIPPATAPNALMCYNTGDLDNPKETNSILEPDIVKQYVDDIEDYPKPLDLALPLFSWGVLIREGKVIKLLNTAQPLDFDDPSKFRRQGHIVQVLEDTYYKAHYLYAGDRIRLEGIAPNTLRTTARLLHKQGLRPRQLIFYHLDSSIIKQYPYEELENIASELVGG
jgi:hypothetical protein